MDIKKRKIKKHQSFNCFGLSWRPVNDGSTSFFQHRKGVVGICIGSFWRNEVEVILSFVKDGYSYETGLKEYKSDRSLALSVSRFHKEIDKLESK